MFSCMAVCLILFAPVRAKKVPNPFIRRGVYILLDLYVYLRSSKAWSLLNNVMLIVCVCACVCACACACACVCVCVHVQPSPWIAAVSCHGPFTPATLDCLPRVSLEHHSPLHMTLLNIFTSLSHIFHKKTWHFKRMHTHTPSFLQVCSHLSNPMPQYQIAIWWENVWRKEECRYIWLLVKCAPLCAWERSHRANRACLNVF